eukprot:11670513-Alexandrium_andersonii.AAC.1
MSRVDFVGSKEFAGRGAWPCEDIGEATAILAPLPPPGLPGYTKEDAEQTSLLEKLALANSAFIWAMALGK